MQFASDIGANRLDEMMLADDEEIILASSQALLSTALASGAPQSVACGQ